MGAKSSSTNDLVRVCALTDLSETSGFFGAVRQEFCPNLGTYAHCADADAEAFDEWNLQLKIEGLKSALNRKTKDYDKLYAPCSSLSLIYEVAR